MSDTQHITLTIFFVGDTKEQAVAGAPWDEWKDAEEYRQENGYKHVFIGTATVLVDQLEISE